MDKKDRTIGILVIVIILLISTLVYYYDFKRNKNPLAGAEPNQSVFDNETKKFQLTIQDIKYLESLTDKCYVTDRVASHCGLELSIVYGNVRIYGADDYGALEIGDSMLPLIQVDDKLIMKKYVQDEELHTCEIIRFKAPDTYNHDYAIHRIIGFDGEKIIAKGDNKEVYEILTTDKVTHRLCGVLK